MAGLHARRGSEMDRRPVPLWRIVVCTAKWVAILLMVCTLWRWTAFHLMVEAKWVALMNREQDRALPAWHLYMVSLARHYRALVWGPSVLALASCVWGFMTELRRKGKPGPGVLATWTTCIFCLFILGSSVLALSEGHIVVGPPRMWREESNEPMRDAPEIPESQDANELDQDGSSHDRLPCPGDTTRNARDGADQWSACRDAGDPGARGDANAHLGLAGRSRGSRGGARGPMGVWVRLAVGTQNPRKQGHGARPETVVD